MIKSIVKSLKILQYQKYVIWKGGVVAFIKFCYIFFDFPICLGFLVCFDQIIFTKHIFNKYV